MDTVTQESGTSISEWEFSQAKLAINFLQARYAKGTEETIGDLVQNAFEAETSSEFKEAISELVPERIRSLGYDTYIVSRLSEARVWRP